MHQTTMSPCRTRLLRPHLLTRLIILVCLQMPVLLPACLTALSVSPILPHSSNVLRESSVTHSLLSYIQLVPYQCLTTSQQAQFLEVPDSFNQARASNTMGKSMSSMQAKISFANHFWILFAFLEPVALKYLNFAWPARPVVMAVELCGRSVNNAEPYLWSISTKNNPLDSQQSLVR